MLVTKTDPALYDKLTRLHARVLESSTCELSEWFPAFDMDKLPQGLGSVFGPRPPFDSAHYWAGYMLDTESCLE